MKKKTITKYAETTQGDCYHITEEWIPQSHISKRYQIFKIPILEMKIPVHQILPSFLILWLIIIVLIIWRGEAFDSKDRVRNKDLEVLRNDIKDMKVDVLIIKKGLLE